MIQFINRLRPGSLERGLDAELQYFDRCVNHWIAAVLGSALA